MNPRLVSDKLTERRFRAAEHRFRCYDFGHDVLQVGAWSQHGKDDAHWRRSVTLSAGISQLEVSFAITFALRTPHMIEAYAQVDGVTPLLIGQWSDNELRPRRHWA